MGIIHRVTRQRNYVLNDVGALKKKITHEKRLSNYTIWKEAKDCSNVVIQMRASFFEFVKACFIEELESNPNITSIENAERAKASTESNGDAYVEYSLEISFVSQSNSHTIKLTAYTTTSQLMIQPINEKVRTYDHLGGQATPRYFAEKFLIQWCNKAVQENRFDDKIRDMYLNALKEQIKKLDISKLEQRKSVKSISDIPVNESTNTSKNKCVNKACSFQGRLNPNNKTAVGLCSNCGNFEHYICVGLSSEDKDDITSGKLKFFCSICFSKKPSIVTSDSSQHSKNTSRQRLGSIPIMAQGYTSKSSTDSAPSSTSMALCSPKVLDTESVSTSKATEQAPSTAQDDSEKKKKCDNCNYATNSTEDLMEHIRTSHKPTCSTCDESFLSLEELKTHVEDGHTFKCSECDFKCTKQTEIVNHVNQSHRVQSIICEEYFTNNSEIDKHLKDKHSHHCSSCAHVTNSLDQLQKHIRENHTPILTCNHCDATFHSEDLLKKHMKEVHKYLCVECNVLLSNQELLNRHISEVHSNKHITCSVCNIQFDSNMHLDQHNQKEHLQYCLDCEDSFKTSTELQRHIEKDHRFPCEYCMVVMNNNYLLRIHRELEHNHYCITCHERFTSVELLSNHNAASHPTKCSYCDEVMTDTNTLSNHLDDEHTYSCEVCSFSGIGDEVMEDHILNNHAVPDEDNFYRCTDCPYKSLDKTKYGNHFKMYHGSQSRSLRAEINDDQSLELRQLKSNFSRLENMYKDTLDENNRIKADHEVKLIKAGDDLAKEIAKNQVLEEKVDILYKLGKSYIENNGCESCRSPNVADPETEIMIVSDDSHVKETDCTWSTNKLRGFKKKNPPPTSENPGRPSISSSNPPHPQDTHHDSPQQNTMMRPSPEQPIQNRLCHFFTNTGWCKFEDRTGLRCKFVHLTPQKDQTVPMCRFGINCNRSSCNFAHPRTRSNHRVSFLDNRQDQASSLNPRRSQDTLAPAPWATGMNHYAGILTQNSGAQPMKQNQNVGSWQQNQNLGSWQHNQNLGSWQQNQNVGSWQQNQNQGSWQQNQNVVAWQQNQNLGPWNQKIGQVQKQ